MCGKLSKVAGCSSVCSYLEAATESLCSPSAYLFHRHFGLCLCFYFIFHSPKYRIKNLKNSLNSFRCCFVCACGFRPPPQSLLLCVYNGWIPFSFLISSACRRTFAHSQLFDSCTMVNNETFSFYWIIKKSVQSPVKCSCAHVCEMCTFWFNCVSFANEIVHPISEYRTFQMPFEWLHKHTHRDFKLHQLAAPYASRVGTSMW